MAKGVGGRGPANIMKHIKGLKFPATKEQIVSHVEKAEGPDTDVVLEVVRKLPEMEYPTPAQILKQVGKIEQFGESKADRKDKSKSHTLVFKNSNSR